MKTGSISMHISFYLTNFPACYSTVYIWTFIKTFFSKVFVKRIKLNNWANTLTASKIANFPIIISSEWTILHRPSSPKIHFYTFPKNFLLRGYIHIKYGLKCLGVQRTLKIEHFLGFGSRTTRFATVTR